MITNTRKATIVDCMKCNEPPECSTAPHPCNIEVAPDIQVGDMVKDLDLIEWEVKEITGTKAFCKRTTTTNKRISLALLTFISRPEKPVEHVFEGVRVDRLRNLTAISFDGEGAGVNLSKRHTMRLTEEK
jgi:hypothetical protein